MEYLGIKYEVKNMMKSPTSFPKNSYVKINPELLIDSVVAFFYPAMELSASQYLYG